MRIDAYMKVSQVYETTKVKKVNQSEKKDYSDALEISDAGKDYHIAKNALKNIPDVREEKVASIKQRLSSGTYNVSAEEIAETLADKILDITV